MAFSRPVYMYGPDFVVFIQDDAYVDSYISTIGVDFVSLAVISLTHLAFWLLFLSSIDASAFVWFAPLQKIRTLEMDGKTIKLQIVSTQIGRSFSFHNFCFFRVCAMLSRVCSCQLCKCTARNELIPMSKAAQCDLIVVHFAYVTVGHGRAGAVQDHHEQLLPRSPRDHREPHLSTCIAFLQILTHSLFSK